MPTSIPAIRSRPTGERSIARAYRQGVRQRARADLPGGPVPVVRADRAGDPRGARAVARAPRDHRRTAVPGRRRCGERAAGAVRSAARRADAAADRARAGRRSTTWRTPREHRSTCTPRSASSTTCGSPAARTTSTAAPGPVTASSPAPSWTRLPTTGSLGCRRHARRLARDLRLEVWSEHLGLPRDDRRCSIPPPASSCGGDRGGPGRLARRRTAAATAARADPPARAATGDPAAGLWAEPLYRLVYDPDGRPRRMRRRGEF